MEIFDERRVVRRTGHQRFEELFDNNFSILVIFWTDYSICLFNSASKFSASSGVIRFKATSR